MESKGSGRAKTAIEWGRQFQVQEATVGRPEIGPGLIEWIAQAPGVGKVTAKGIVKHFGDMEIEELLETIKDPARLEEIDGIGPAKAKAVARGSRKRSERDQLTMDLRDKHVPLAAVARVLRKFGDDASEVVRRYPYGLLDVRGIGFATADKIALASGFVSYGSFQRIQAGVVETLNQAAGRGHAYLPIKILLNGDKDRGLKGATRLLKLKEATIGGYLRKIVNSGKIHIDGNSVYLDKNNREESVVSIRLSALSKVKVATIEAGALPGQLMTITSNETAVTLSHDQNYAVTTSCHQPVIVVTGGPGVGKTAITQAIVKTWHRAGLNIELCAPTGKAAKQLEKATGCEAKTIHRLLEYGPQGFARSRQFRLSCQALVVDESSMLTTSMAARLLDAIPLGCRIVIVGDQDQLPSIGYGAVLRDIIKSEKIPVIRLNKVFRQSAGSRIVTNAHRFINGKPLEYPGHGENSDFWIHRKNTSAGILEALDGFLTRHIPERFGLDPLKDVMVLTPLNGTELGTVALNLRLQSLLNPDGQKVGNWPIRVGDRVMQVRNNYALKTFNGDVGAVLSWDQRKKEAWLQFENRDILYTKEHLEGLLPAYACTVHKAQGGGFPAVIMIVHDEHKWHLKRSLVYTGMTRAEKLLVLIGQSATLTYASGNLRDANRFTGLAEKLLHPPSELPELNRAEMIKSKLYTCDACQRSFASDSPQIFECPECGESDQIRELGNE